MAFVVTTLAGCASAPDRSSSSRYTITQDRAPSVDMDVSGLEDARPRYERPKTAGNKSPYTVWGETYRVLKSNDGYVARGTASWYGEKFHGHQTSNGEVFDMYKMSAAHKTLRLPAFARVTNLDNGRSVIVRVNDRGPFHSDRLIDLSYAAAKKLGYQSRGTARVEVAAITVRPDGQMFLAGKPFTPGQSDTALADRQEPAKPVAAGSGQEALFVQLASFSSRAPAEALLSKLQGLVSQPLRVRSVDTGAGRFHRVQVGPFSSEADARATQASLEARGYAQSILLTDVR
ncbi:septal ring lytic transglycosylase RlpA family protein [Marinobacter sp. C2H3]|uniref:septal ring lytic transglycosylase RlpA family protein n=1 Tax=Marinobacter sp. C2H3 TaxID=3119003 RepID=UPI00300F1CD4